MATGAAHAARPPNNNAMHAIANETNGLLLFARVGIIIQPYDYKNNLFAPITNTVGAVDIVFNINNFID
ncbi:MAG: hypothetical protein V9H25_08655 [Candidatus Competibacter sp.]